MRRRSRLGEELLMAAFVVAGVAVHHYRLSIPPLDEPRLWPWWMWAGSAGLAAFILYALARLILAFLYRIPYRERIFKTPVRGPESGWVYVLSNASMPGVYKVGSTARDPAARARELRTTGIATPFVVAWSVDCDYARRVEIQAHRLLDGCRISADREFFKTDLGTIRKAIGKAGKHVKQAMPQ